MSTTSTSLPFLAVATASLLAGCTAEQAPVAQQTDDIIGCGSTLEDRTAHLDPLLDESALEVVAELPYPPGNVTVSEEGRVFFSFHPAGNKGDIKVAELVDGEVVPFPSDMKLQGSLHTVLSVRVQAGMLWMLDYGNFGLHKARLYAFDLETEERVVDYQFPRAAASKGSMLNDFQVAPDGKTVFISDPRLMGDDQGLVVVDLDREFPIARRRLVGHDSVRGGGHDVVVDEKRVKVAGVVCPEYGVDGLTLDQNGEYLYYGSLNRGDLWRVSSHDLRFEQSGLLDEELAERVEKVADTTMSDGMASDAAGHVYLTDMEHSAIMRVDEDGQMEMVVQSELLRWPDGLGWGPDGALYVTASALHEILPEPILTEKDVAAGAPYHILRFVPQAACSDDQSCIGQPGH